MVNKMYTRWLNQAERMISDKISLTSTHQLKASMPICGSDNAARYLASTHLEFFGRLLCGIAPIIEKMEGSINTVLPVQLSEIYQAIDSVTNPDSKDYLNFSYGTQPLVDVAFFALAFLRSPNVLWKGLPSETKQHVLAAFKLSATIKPHFNNWLLFAGMIEAFYFMTGNEYDKMRVDYALRQHEQWYLGDGHYGDGALYRADYYNSYVILPFLLQITESLKGQNKDWDNIGDNILKRAKRYAELQERMIGVDGTFPPIGRSICYRGAAFHLLAQLALMQELPDSLSPAQVREALWAVIDKTLVSPSNYDDEGWLRIGLNGYQPDLGENYISTGSLYLTSVIFLPLGLPEESEFWSAPAESWTQRKIWWLSKKTPADKAL